MDYEAEFEAWLADQAARHGHDPVAVKALLREQASADWQVDPAARIDVWADDDVVIANKRDIGA